MHTKLLALSAALAAGATGTVATAAAQTTQPALPHGATAATVTPVASLHAGQTAPFDVPGVKAIRRGKAIPAGYVLPGRHVTTQGSSSAGASILFRCPDHKRLRSFATQGSAGFVAYRDYVGKRATVVDSFRSGGDGTIYAVCR